MPELPEVQTTASILNKITKNRKIISVWTDYNSPYYKNKENIKDPKYFKKFCQEINGQKIFSVTRRAKNVIIELSGNSYVLIHMKMTGQLLYGHYDFNKDSKTWTAKKDTPLSNPTSRFIHLIFQLDNGKFLALSDMRKFATVKFIPNKKELELELNKFGPEPLDKSFDWQTLKQQLNRKPKQKIKTALMDSALVAGIGNIYSDEILWKSKIHPERRVVEITDQEFKVILKNIKLLLEKGIVLGGDSMSDYRNPYGEKGAFQLHHKVYGRKNEKCPSKQCGCLICRKVINGRSAHFCPRCQK